MMKEEKLANLLAEGLDAIGRGVPVEDFLADYPGDAGELRELLETTLLVQSTPAVTPSPDFKGRARQRLVNKLKDPQQAVTFLGVGRPIRQTLGTKPRRFAMNWFMVVALIGGLLAGGGGVAYAAEESLPGDVFYSVKTGIQDVQLGLSDDEGDVDLLLDFMEEDIEAVRQLVQKGRMEDAGAGIRDYQENLDLLLQTRERVSYEDMPNEDALNQRIQTELMTHSQLMTQLQEQVKDQLQVKEQLQQAIQAAESAAQYGPAEGGPPEESGSPNGAGPGEPQQNQDEQSSPKQDGNGGPNEEGGNGDGGDGGMCGQDELDGEDVEDCGSGSDGHSGPGGKP